MKRVKPVKQTAEPEIVKQAHAFKSKLNARMRDDYQL